MSLHLDLDNLHRHSTNSETGKASGLEAPRGDVEALGFVMGSAVPVHHMGSAVTSLVKDSQGFAS